MRPDPSPAAFVIGHPIAHSRSPLIHRHWFEQHGVTGTYDAIDVTPEDLPGFMDRIREGEFTGGNVTIPHKREVLRLADHAEEAALAIGASNTLIRQHDGKILARNTDVIGFTSNLDQNCPGWDQSVGKAVVLGAGGAARAILFALIERGIEHILILNRSIANADALIAEFTAPAPVRVQSGTLDEFASHAGSTNLLINTTSIGMNGTRFDQIDLSPLPKTAIVHDIVYTPLITPLLADARQSGLKTVDGLGMLLHQAVPAFKAWFDIQPEVTPALRKMVEKDLGLS